MRGGLGWEEAEELGIDAVDDAGEVGLPVEEIELVDLHREHLAPVFMIDEVVVTGVEVFEVVELHLLFIFPAPPLDVLHEVWYGGLEINHQVGILDDGHHRLEEVHIAVEVAVVEVSHGIVVGGEDIDALKDAAVLDDGLLGAGDVEQVAEALLEEIDLQGERPPGDVLVVVLKIWIELHGLKLRCPPIVTGEHRGERGLSTSYISCYGNMHLR